MDKILNNTSPSCTVLMPVYNGSKFLHRAIENLKLSLRINDELLIINDGSDDLNCVEFEKITSMDSRIKVINRAHMGLVSTLNFGISISKHEFVARADVDDLYTKDRFEIQSEFLSKNLEFAAVFCDYEFVDVDGRSFGIIPAAISPQLTKLSLLNSQRTPHPGVMFRKSKVEEIGGYLEKDFPAEDLSLWMRLSNQYAIGSIPRVLLYYTIHESSITNCNNKKMKNKAKVLSENFAMDISENDVKVEAQKMLKIYREEPRSSTRKLLFVFDLLTLFKIKNNLKTGEIIKIMWNYRSWFSISTIFAGSQLFLLRSRRHKIIRKY